MQQESKWERKLLGELVDINVENLSQKTPGNTSIKYIDIASIEKTGYITQTKQYTFSNAPSRARRVVRTGDVIVSTVRPYLKAFALVTDEHNGKICSTGFAVLRPKKGVDSRFIYQTVIDDRFIEYLKSKMTGSNYPAVRPIDIAEYPLDVPKYEEQRKIAAILSSVDEAIEKTEAIIEQTEKVKKGLMQQLLTKGIGHTKFKKTEIGDIPEDWTIEKLMDISSLMTNGFVGVASPFYSESEKDSVPYLMSNNIRANRIDLTKLVRITNEFHQQNQKSVLQEGDLLTVQSGHIGTSCVVPREFEGANCHALIITRFSDKRVNPYFVSYYLNSQVGMRRLKTIFVGSTVPHINVKDFKKFAIPIPTVEEQNRIVSILQSFDQKIYNEQDKLSKLQIIKKGLMQVLLTGEVRVKVEDEVMSQ
jgi:type I restriction enzyme, S subunit